MPFDFKKKTVYIISQQAWGDMRVSKHHYALELAKGGSRVYFIGPPDISSVKSVNILNSDESENLFLVKYKPIFRGRKFLPDIVFNFFVEMQAKRLVHKIGFKPDVVWSFHPFLFENLKVFGAKVSIYFGSDLFVENRMPGEVKSADVIFGVSPTIVNQLKAGNKNIHFINHGLSSVFENFARNMPPKASAKQNGRIKAGYAGNLLMEALDREVMKNVILKNPDVDFIFWGQYNNKGNFIGFQHPEISGFVSFLKEQQNVELRGVVSTAVLANEMQSMDLFWLCWKSGKGMWDGSNSHKILEYLSTGKPVVSHHVLTYKNSSLLYMPPTEDNRSYQEIFAQTVNKIKSGERYELEKERIAFSLDNTYSLQIGRIEKMISSVFEME